MVSKNKGGEVKVKNRLPELDALRGLAALFVVLYHYTYQYYKFYPSENHVPYSVNFGHYGVEAFFFVSGFVIFMSLENTKQIQDFVAHRFIRLFPTYWISVFISFVLISIFPLPGLERNFTEFLLNLTMVHKQFGVESIDGVYWTLLVELKFYFLMVIIYYFNLLKYIEKISIPVLIVIAGFYLSGLEYGIVYKIGTQALIFPYFSYFVSGIVFYKIYKNTANMWSYIALILSFGVSLLLDTHGNYIAIVVIYLLFMLVSFGLLKKIAIKPLVFLGAISYALYLTHQNIGYLVLNYCKELNITPTVSLFIAITVSLLIASAITYLFEKRVMKTLRTLYDNRSSKKN